MISNILVAQDAQGTLFGEVDELKARAENMNAELYSPPPPPPPPP